MKRNLTLSFALIAAVLMTASVGLAGESYSVDPAHSSIGFSVRHMGLSSVKGQFNDYSAEFIVDEADLAKSSIVLEIVASSIDTGEEGRDDHLRSDDFLDVENHGQIVFKSKSIKKTGDGEYEAIGDLTLHGVTKEVTLELEVGGPLEDGRGNMRIGIEGDVTIDRQDFGVNFSRVMDNGGLVVGNDVKISFAVEATRKV